MGAIFAVLGMRTVYDHASPIIQSRLAVLGLAVMIFWSGLMLVNSGRFGEETAHTPGAHGLGALPIQTGLRFSQWVMDSYEVVFADMPEWILNSFVGRTFPVIRDNRAPLFTIYPAKGSVYITIGEDEPITYFTRSLGLRDNTHISFHYSPSYEQLMRFLEVRMDVPTTQGLRLIGYTLTDSQIHLFWQVDFIAPEVKDLILGAFVHVYNADGERVINTGGGALEGWRWRVGDIYVDQIPLDLPEDGAPFTIQFGGYDGVHGVNLQFDFPDDDLPASTVMIIPVP
jgi:hypothetical protein